MNEMKKTVKESKDKKIVPMKAYMEDLKGKEGHQGIKNAVTPPSIPSPAKDAYLKPVKVYSLKQAKKLLSRIIYRYQLDEIEAQKARTLTYLLSIFIAVVKESDLEQRLESLEDKLGISLEQQAN